MSYTKAHFKLLEAQALACAKEADDLRAERDALRAQAETLREALTRARAWCSMRTPPELLADLDAALAKTGTAE